MNKYALTVEVMKGEKPFATYELSKKILVSDEEIMRFRVLIPTFVAGIFVFSIENFEGRITCDEDNWNQNQKLFVDGGMLEMEFYRIEESARHGNPFIEAHITVNRQGKNVSGIVSSYLKLESVSISMK